MGWDVLLLQASAAIALFVAGHKVGTSFAKYDKAEWKRKEELYQRDMETLRGMILKRKEKTAIRHYLKRTSFRYYQKFVPTLEKTTISDFLTEKEERGLVNLIHRRGEPHMRDFLDWRVKDWSRFPQLMEHVDDLSSITLWLDTSGTSHENIHLIWSHDRAEPILELIQEVCEPTPEEHLSEPARPESDVPSEPSLIEMGASVGMARFEELTEGVSGVSHLRTPYLEMLELLDEKDRLMADVIEKAKQTLQDIEGLIEARRHQDKVEKALRDSQHIQNIRRSAGLSVEEGEHLDPRPLVIESRKVTEKVFVTK